MILSVMLSALIGCDTPAESYRTGIDPETPLPEAIAACSRAAEPDECVSVAVRNHPQEAGLDHCRRIASARWRAECHFSLAEPLAGRGDRWGALMACGEAGNFYDECLYHAWTFDLQTVVLKADPPGLFSGGARTAAQMASAVSRARPLIAFWSSIGTARSRDGQPMEELLWADLWYSVWWYGVYPGIVRLTDCALLPDPEDRRRCEGGTRMYVTRLVAEPLLSAQTSPVRDRLCRGGGEALAAVHPDQWSPDLQPAALEGLALGCGGTRTWTPVFRPRNDGAPLPSPGVLPPGTPPPGTPGSPPGAPPG